MENERDQTDTVAERNHRSLRPADRSDPGEDVWSAWRAQECFEAVEDARHQVEICRSALAHAKAELRQARFRWQAEKRKRSG